MYRNGLKSLYLNNTSMAQCKDKRKVRTKIASHFRNVWKCMDKKILKPLKNQILPFPPRMQEKKADPRMQEKKSEEQDH